MELDESLIHAPLTDADYAAARRYSPQIVWSPDDGAYLAMTPEIPEILTHGVTQEAALEAGVEVIAVWISDLRNRKLPLPEPRSFDDDRDRQRSTVRDLAIAGPAVFDAERIERLRARLGLSQQAFANLLHASVASVRAWEYGNRAPEGTTLRLLEVLERNPEVVMGPTVSRKQGAVSAGVRLTG